MWVARNQDGTLKLFDSMPKRGEPYSEWVNAWCLKLNNDLFPELKWEDEPIEVNIFTNEFVQGFGDACYKQGEQDACRFEYGENPEGNLTIEEYVDSKNKTL